MILWFRASTPTKGNTWIYQFKLQKYQALQPIGQHNAESQNTIRLCYFCSSCSCWLPTSFFPNTVDVKSLLQQQLQRLLQQALPIRLNSSSVQQHSAWLGPPIFTSHQHYPRHPGSLAAGVACYSWSQPKDTSPPVPLCWCFPQAPPESLLDKDLSSNSLDHMHNI